MLRLLITAATLLCAAGYVEAGREGRPTRSGRPARSVGHPLSGDSIRLKLALRRNDRARVTAWAGEDHNLRGLPVHSMLRVAEVIGGEAGPPRLRRYAALNRDSLTLEQLDLVVADHPEADAILADHVTGQAHQLQPSDAAAILERISDPEARRDAARGYLDRAGPRIGSSRVAATLPVDDALGPYVHHFFGSPRPLIDQLRRLDPWERVPTVDRYVARLARSRGDRVDPAELDEIASYLALDRSAEPAQRTATYNRVLTRFLDEMTARSGAHRDRIERLRFVEYAPPSDRFIAATMAALVRKHRLNPDNIDQPRPFRTSGGAYTLNVFAEISGTRLASSRLVWTERPGFTGGRWQVKTRIARSDFDFIP